MPLHALGLEASQQSLGEQNYLSLAREAWIRASTWYHLLQYHSHLVL
jgi:hypothetical protein